MRETKNKVVIVDYQLGNLFSVKQACDVVGINASITSNRDEVATADALILPGVGAFMEAMKNLDRLGLVEVIRDTVKGGKPIFGICLGQQLLFTESEEFGAGKGLDLIPGYIRKFPAEFNSRPIKIPQIGWNQVYAASQDWANTPLKDIQEHEYMYFVHSYFVMPQSADCILTKTNYADIEYCSGILAGNIFATQFHPEKSTNKGLTIYKNWAEINNLI